MVAFNFPNSPAPGTSYQGYSWDGEKWVSGANGAIYVSDPPPPNAPANSLWWNSTNGTLYVRYNDGNSTQWVSIAGGGGAAAISGQCRLDWIDTVHIKLSPFNGDKIQIAGAVYQIPSAGILAANASVFVDGVANQNLGPNTVYNVYLFNNAGVLTIDYSTAARGLDVTPGNVGVQIKAGNNSRTLIGKLETNASNQFTATTVISWFNRRYKLVTANDPNDRSVSAIWTEISTLIRARFLSWGTDEPYFNVSYSANLKHATVGAAMYIAAGIDGTGTILGGNSQSEHVANNLNALANSVPFAAAEGVHFATMVGGAVAGSTVFAGTNVASIITVGYWG